MRPNTAFMTFHFYETPTNVLTNLALDPASQTPEYKVTAIRIEKIPDDDASGTAECAAAGMAALPGR